jgi:hypothetical protein
MTRDAIMAELLEIEGLLEDDRLNDSDRYAHFVPSKRCEMSSIPGRGNPPPRPSTASITDRAKRFHCCCIDAGPLPAASDYCRWQCARETHQRPAVFKPWPGMCHDPEAAFPWASFIDLDFRSPRVTFLPFDT